MESTRKVIIFGCGGHSRSVTDVILLGDPGSSLVYVDDNARDNETLYGFNVVRNYNHIADSACFVAIGDNTNRMLKTIELACCNIISVVSIKAQVGFRASIGHGCFLGNFCHVGPEATIGVGTILNTASIIEHEVQIGNYCHIGPNATISGRCKIGDLVFVGVSATVKDYINICSNVVIGAGATVVKDITEPGTYIGTPAVKIYR
jgi:UDP-N-acetylbacillosamine N-acetyltransferase